MNTLNLIYYSPTGSTKKIVTAIGQNMDLSIASEYNISKADTEFTPVISETCLTIIGVPVYAGRLPVNAIEALKKFQSNNSPVVIVVVYGNRAFEDSLLELNDIVSSCGFNVVGAAAFIGEHSYSSTEKPIAHGRPDEIDELKCLSFAHSIKEKLKHNQQRNSISDLNIPGNYPYKQRRSLPQNIYPITDLTKCSNCGICVDICPTNAITIHPTLSTNGDLCTWCCACVKACPNEARIFDNSTINAIKERLFSTCSERQEPEFFI